MKITTLTVVLIVAGSGVIGLFAYCHNVNPDPQKARKRLGREAEHGAVSRAADPKNVYGYSELRDVEFHGRVIDETGIGISSAIVSYSRPGLPPLDLPDGTRERDGTARRGVDGRFAISGIKAFALRIGVEAQGYEPVGNRWSVFYYSEGWNREKREASGIDLHRPDIQYPVLFQLKKIRNDPLFHMECSRRLASRQVFSLEHSLGKASNGLHVVELESVVDHSSLLGAPDERQIYNWFAEISVPGGGVMLRERDSDLLAPESGYVPTIRIDVSTRDPKKWKISHSAGYFIRFADGTYGRIQVYIGTDKTTPPLASIESWFNPSGSRSTAFDNSNSLRLLQSPDDSK